MPDSTIPVPMGVLVRFWGSAHPFPSSHCSVHVPAPAWGASNPDAPRGFASIKRQSVHSSQATLILAGFRSESAPSCHPQGAHLTWGSQPDDPGSCPCPDCPTAPRRAGPSLSCPLLSLNPDPSSSCCIPGNEDTPARLSQLPQALSVQFWEAKYQVCCVPPAQPDASSRWPWPGSSGRCCWGTERGQLEPLQVTGGSRA